MDYYCFERDAVGKICPFSMSVSSQYATSRCCKGSQCMSWQDYGEREFEDSNKVKSILKVGYCKLIEGS